MMRVVVMAASAWVAAEVREGWCAMLFGLPASKPPLFIVRVCSHLVGARDKLEHLFVAPWLVGVEPQGKLLVRLADFCMSRCPRDPEHLHAFAWVRVRTCVRSNGTMYHVRRRDELEHTRGVTSVPRKCVCVCVCPT
jgi:hypothetical protein